MNMQTLDLFRDDPYRRSVAATIIGVTDRGVVLDRTVLYPTGGGQPGDSGTLRAHGAALPVSEAIYGDPRTAILHLIEEPSRLAQCEDVEVEVDWARRYRHMRMHTCLHLLSAVLPYPVTGGQIGAEEGRLDFDIPEAGLEREAITGELNRLITGDYAVSTEWITDAELDANPGLVKTMSVKPPRGSGRVRLVRIGRGEATVDLQPCGGTHVARTSEIGRVTVTKIEKKGARNRRVRVAFED
jgi:misacylated tRNA(Ala) deacylase